VTLDGPYGNVQAVAICALDSRSPSAASTSASRCETRSECLAVTWSSSPTAAVP
jgi:hypothetical protein